jgi:hypothetical protein
VTVAASGSGAADVRDVVARLRTWGEARDWAGADPYDALNAPLSRALTLDTALGRRLLTQAVKLSPLDLRPLLRIPPAHNEKAIALVASGYASLGSLGDTAASDSAGRWLDWLVPRRAAGDRGWGYHFEVQTRVFRYAAGTPNAIATSFAIQALLDGVELLGDDRWLAAAQAGARWLRDELLASGPTGPYFRYLPGEGELVHNANALCAAALARYARLADDAVLAATAREALETTLAAQAEDGSWPYAEGHTWIDNFHTAYVLESLAAFDDADVARALESGLAFWRDRLFLPDGTPRYDARSTLPLDAHCYASAIDTFVAVGDLPRARRTAAVLFRDLLDPRGFIRFQRRRFWTSRVQLVRWTNAPAFRALARLLVADARLD